MRRKLLLWEILGFVVVGVLGALGHFLFAWSGKNPLVAAFAAVNESAWEHMKLLFFPTFLFSGVQIGIQGRYYPNFLATRCISLLTGLLLIPIIFYTYSGALGWRVEWFDVLIFYLADAGMFLLDYYLLRRGHMTSLWQQLLGLLILWAIAFAFVWCTFQPIHLDLWRDPLTGRFGIV